MWIYPRIDRAAVRALIGCWLASFASLVYAFTSFSTIARAFDYESLFWAALFGLAGGVTRTAFWLASDNFVLLRFWRQLAKDLIIAMIGGGVVWLVMEWLAVIWPHLFPSQFRMLAVFGAGYSRGRWNGFLGEMVDEGAKRAKTFVRNAGSATLAGQPREAAEGMTTIIPLEHLPSIDKKELDE